VLFNSLNKTKVDVDIPIVKYIALVSNLDVEPTCNMLCFQYNALSSEDIIEKNLGLYMIHKVSKSHA